MGPPNGARLPPTFTSLYRLFLRATSATVLHHSGATRNLRRLWRPIFHGAAGVVHKLQYVTPESSEREELETWLKLWNARMDSTLELLCSASQSRGLPHKLTRNLASLQHRHIMWAEERYYSVSRTWRPGLPHDDPEYTPGIKMHTKARMKLENRRIQGIFNENGWGALGEVVRMAEGRDGISLGRATFNQRKA